MQFISIIIDVETWNELLQFSSVVLIDCGRFVHGIGTELTLTVQNLTVIMHLHKHKKKKETALFIEIVCVSRRW